MRHSNKIKVVGNGIVGVEMHFLEPIPEASFRRSRVFYVILDEEEDAIILKALEQAPEIYDHFEPPHYNWEEVYNKAGQFLDLVKSLLKPGDLPGGSYSVYKPLFWVVEDVLTDPLKMKVSSPQEIRKIALARDTVYQGVVEGMFP